MATWSNGTKLTVAATGTTGSISDGGFEECTDDHRESGNNAGFPFADIEFKTASGGFSAAPTAGAFIYVHLQAIHTDGDEPDIDANNRNVLVAFRVDPADTQQYWRTKVPVAIPNSAFKLWVEWVDGGAGTASLDSGWELTITPVELS